GVSSAAAAARSPGLRRASCAAGADRSMPAAADAGFAAAPYAPRRRRRSSRPATVPGRPTGSPGRSDAPRYPRSRSAVLEHDGTAPPDTVVGHTRLFDILGIVDVATVEDDPVGERVRNPGEVGAPERFPLRDHDQRMRTFDGGFGRV